MAPLTPPPARGGGCVPEKPVDNADAVIDALPLIGTRYRQVGSFLLGFRAMARFARVLAGAAHHVTQRRAPPAQRGSVIGTK